MTHVVFVEFTDSSDRTLTGINVYDRDNGGSFVPPQGTSFPSVDPTPGEFFLRTDTQTLFVRNQANDAWQEVFAAPVNHASAHVRGGSDEVDADALHISFVPDHYSPDSSIVEASDITELAAHLKGIDNRFGQGPIFGSNKIKAESLGATVTTEQDTWVNKISVVLTVTSGNEGDYHLEWSYFWSHDSTQNDFEGRITQDGNDPPIMLHVEEPKDSGGSGPGGTNQRKPASGFIFLDGLTAGTYTFNLDLRTRVDGVESTMIDARMRIYRDS